MRLSIPGSSAVDSTFRQLAKRLNTSRKRINALGAKQMRIADYEDAQRWIEIARSVGEFAERSDAFAQEWKRFVKATRMTALKSKRVKPDSQARLGVSKPTPTWKFCEPALKVLASRDDAATTDEVLGSLAESLAQSLSQSDLAVVGSHDVPRWHLAARRAYRQCQKEGWIEKRKDDVWKITAKGRGLVAQKG